MKCMHGWTGAILHIDLTDRTHLLEHPTPETYQTWIGCKGLVGQYLRPHVTRSWDIPEMPLIFMTGPLVGTASPTSGRMCVMSRSPLTGTVGEASVGGSLGTELKKAGFDGIVITGRSDRLCGIEITDESVAIRDATCLSGMETGPLYAQLRRKGAMAATSSAKRWGGTEGISRSLRPCLSKLELTVLTTSIKRGSLKNRMNSLRQIIV